MISNLKNKEVSTEVRELKKFLTNSINSKITYNNLSVYHSNKMNVLIKVVSKTTGIKPQFYHDLLEIPENNNHSIELIAEEVKSRIELIEINISYIIAVLSQKEQHLSKNKKDGAYYTDYRIADYISSDLNGPVHTVIDPACGTGILLIGFILSSSNKYSIDFCIENNLIGADKSLDAVKGAILSLSCLTKKKKIIRKLKTQIIHCDSLLDLLELTKERSLLISHVIGNPPWEKLKVSRYEEDILKNDKIIYGSLHPKRNNVSNNISEKSEISKYIDKIIDIYVYQGEGEKNLYSLFLELSTNLVMQGGEVSLLIPAGFIRAKGLQKLRSKFFSEFGNIQISLFDNKAKYFDIDSRFKFIHLKMSNEKIKKENEIIFSTINNNLVLVEKQKSIKWKVNELKKIRPDLTIPEVRNLKEKQLFTKMYNAGPAPALDNSTWNLEISREVDMTQKRHLFAREFKTGYVPLIEGRMVWHYNAISKSYISGGGRAAKWKTNYFNDTASLCTQWYYPVSTGQSSSLLIARQFKFRIGFCDIAGQTNERSMMAAYIPEKVLCGNKVPTVTFTSDDSNNTIGYCWLGIVNSFLFDWMLRRILTTTVNLFLLKSLPLPHLDFKSKEAENLSDYSKRLSQKKYNSLWERAELLVNIERIVYDLYDINYKYCDLIMDDFPLLDRGQSPIDGELKSTITKDFLLLRLSGQDVTGRVALAKNKNAIPFIPSSFVKEISNE